MLDKSQLRELATAAEKAAMRASEIIRQYRTSDLHVAHKENMPTEASSVVTQVDLECQEAIISMLSDITQRYDIGTLTEEMQDDQSRLLKDYFWCIDPLDGTLPFIENRPGYAVSIALVSKSGEPMVGVINDPITQKSFAAIRDQGIINEDIWSTNRSDTENSLVCYFDRSFLKHQKYEPMLNALEGIRDELKLDELKVLTGAGAVMNAMSILNHEHAVYFKFPKKESGGGSLWDYAATACVFKELNQPATDIHGERLDLNNAHSTFLNQSGVLYASSARLAELVRNIYKSLRW